MPVFDFECSKCKKKFSELVYSSEKILCPKCGSKKIKKIFSPFYTISDDTKFETHAPDLPSMEEWRKAKYKYKK